MVGERGYGIGKEVNGLGIAHAKKTVESRGGRLEIEPEISKGTKVQLTFRCAIDP